MVKPMRLDMRMRLVWTALTFAVLATVSWLLWHRAGTADFVRLMNRGNNLMLKGDLQAAVEAYNKALDASPESTDARLNLANACLRLNRDADALEMAKQTLALDRNNPAAYYLMGCAYMHLSEWKAAVQAFQQSQAIDPRVTALNFQLGLAHEALGERQEALNDFQAVTLYDPSHPTAHYLLSRLYERLGKADEAANELREHQQLLAKGHPEPSDPVALEQCAYTKALEPFILEQPVSPGIPVHFVNATDAAFAGKAAGYQGPIAIVDYGHDGRNSIVAREPGGGFRLLDNRAGRFSPLGSAMPAAHDAKYGSALVGDLVSDASSCVVVLGEDGSKVYRITPEGRANDYTDNSGLGQVRAVSGLLADLDFTGNLDLVTVKPDNSGLQFSRNIGGASFDTDVDDSGLPGTLPGATAVEMEDWGNDGLPGIFVTMKGQPPRYFAKKRASAFVPGTVSDKWPAASVLAAGDLNNDLELDVILALQDGIQVILSGRKEAVSLPLPGFHPAGIILVDFDNDGWLDILAYGPDGIRVWRNEGHAGFRDVTAALGLDSAGPVTRALAADFDGDGDSDLILETPKGLQFWRNDGGDANRQLKLHLTGTRSNESALGMRIDVSAGNWRTSRTVHALPIEIGMGSHAKLDALTVHWSDLATTSLDVPVSAAPVAVVEPKLPSGSCPYLYVWDGHGFRFVTDILGAAPLGLPLSKSKFVPSDPEEILALGSDESFPAHNGAYEVRVTDELREVLYLDEARLMVVDHPSGTLVYSTSKLRASGPFPSPEIWTLRPLGAPVRAERSDGLDVTAALARADASMVSPTALRRPQLRGFAEPYSVTMDFGPVDTSKPLVLALTGWLQFGGGMANIAGSIDPSIGPPFPTLEVQLPDGSWRKVETEVGAPSGKTKTILVDLEGKLPSGALSLRLVTSFEIHWDAAVLCERVDSQSTRQQSIHADAAGLHWRGFSRYEPQAPSQPLTPLYDEVVGSPPWDHTPAGWCTRYGDVRALVEGGDNRLAILNGGDELALSFGASRLVPKAPGTERDFFLYAYGWDKDADFHVARGWEVEPLPFRSMDDQAYGRQERPAGLSEDWIDAYNTRWVGSIVLARKASSNHQGR
jgi:Flp pilus assembly protein TadD